MNARGRNFVNLAREIGPVMMTEIYFHELERAVVLNGRVALGGLCV